MILQFSPAHRLMAGAIALTAILTACGGGNQYQFPYPPLPSPSPTGTAVATATPVPISTAAAFSASQVTALPAVTAPPVGQTPKPVAVALPATSVGISGSISLPIANASSIPPGTQVQTTLTNTAPTGLPVLTPQAIKRFLQQRGVHVEGESNSVVLLYLWLAFSAGVTTTSQPPITFTLPSNEITTGAYYYVALYDPTRPDLGWQLGFEGPGTVSGSQISFTGNPSPFSFAPFDFYYFALYAQPSTVATPSPAPTQSPTPVPTPTPTPIALSGIQLTAIGQTSTIAPSFAGPYSAFSSDTSVATVSVSGANVTVTAVGAGGPVTITIGSPNGTETVQVTVTTTTVPVQ